VGFGAIARAGTSGGTTDQVVFTIYDDVSTVQGNRPGTLLALTASGTLAPAANTYDFHVQTERALTGGRWYWVGGVYRVARHMAGTQNAAGGATIDIAYRSLQWNAALPQPFDADGAVVTAAASRFVPNYYLMVVP